MPRQKRLARAGVWRANWLNWDPAAAGRPRGGWILSFRFQNLRLRLRFVRPAQHRLHPIVGATIIGGAAATFWALSGQSPHGDVVTAGYDISQAVERTVEKTLDRTIVLPDMPDLDLDPGNLTGTYATQASYTTSPGAASLPGATAPAGDNQALLRIGRGQSFYDALGARGASHDDIVELVRVCKPFRNLRSVRSGEVFRIQIGPGGRLQSLGFDLDEESYVTWVREGNTYEREDGTYPVEHRYRGVSGSVHGSLIASLERVGAPTALAPKLADILGWDIDFRRDLREGDTFRVLYEEVWRDARLVRSGAIQAVEFTSKGKTSRAYLFDNGHGDTGYFDQNGGSLQKALLRAPLQYSRISSDFSYHRFHPVLNQMMPHLGIDYAAPLGTPVKAAGDGVVMEASAGGGNGRYVHIRHANKEYETYYLHLSRFGKGIHSGTRVAQGDIIGYVGATGYATGPHLDYRVKQNGKFINPRTLNAPSIAPLAGARRLQFREHAEQLALTLKSLPMQQSIEVPTLYAGTPPARMSGALAVADLPAVIRAVD